MESATLWWILAGSAVAVELMTGTFYLLMLALGMAAAAIAAHMGSSTVTQLIAAALVGGGAVALWHQWRKKRESDPSARASRSVNLDVGETVHIEAWAADGTANVHYRGANWVAIHRPGASLSTGPHRVSELVGNRLLVDKI